MQRYFLYLAYNGTRYHGWQVQPNGVTVQERIEEALALLLRRETPIVGEMCIRDSRSTCPFDGRTF